MAERSSVAKSRTNSRTRTRRRNKKSTWTKTQKRNVAIIFVILFLVCFAYGKKVVSLKIENAKLQKEHTELVEQRREIKEKLKNVNNVEYIEEQARKQLQLMYPDEIMFKYSEEDEKSDE